MCVNGPSPRVWGIPFATPESHSRQRSIPTRVGNTLVGFIPAVRTDGPSPRVWGIRSYNQHHPLSKRSIPTRVGNTMDLSSTTDLTAVHPHACGEYEEFLVPPVDEGGPSPRVWGILRVRQRRPNDERSIPTRVGNTRRSPPPSAPSPVHPHACGEYLRRVDVQRYDCGPSPRVWGIPLATQKVQESTRSIPTRVGNTSHVGKLHDFHSVHPHACGEYRYFRYSRFCIIWSIPTRVGNT